MLAKIAIVILLLAWRIILSIAGLILVTLLIMGIFYLLLKIRLIRRFAKKILRRIEESETEEVKQSAQQPQEPRHYMSQAEYDQYKREHGIK